MARVIATVKYRLLAILRVQEIGVVSSLFPHNRSLANRFDGADNGSYSRKMGMPTAIRDTYESPNLDGYSSWPRMAPSWNLRRR
jgi:hypothetical protein